MGFGLTPAAGFPPPTPDEFPNYIQFQSDGTDLGSNDADTVNFRRGMTARRGTGANANVVTVDGAEVQWADVTTDYVLTANDVSNGLRCDNAGSSITVTVPGDTELDIDGNDTGVSVLIYQQGVAAVGILAESGVTVHVRSALQAITAGQNACVSLIRTGPNEWVLCGDLATA